MFAVSRLLRTYFAVFCLLSIIFSLDRYFRVGFSLFPLPQESLVSEPEHDHIHSKIPEEGVTATHTAPESPESGAPESTPTKYPLEENPNHHYASPVIPESTATETPAETSTPYYDASNHKLAVATPTVISYPTDYQPALKDDEECEAFYSHRYLDHIATHHESYCKDGSRSSLECFRSHKNQGLCVAKGVVIDHKGPKAHTAMHCQLRDFVAEAKSNPAADSALLEIPNISEMGVGFVHTGVGPQINSWGLSMETDTLAMENKICGPGNFDKKWTLLVKRENGDNVWHNLQEIWAAMLTLDVLQIAIDPSTQKPYLEPSELSEVQLVFAEDDKDVKGGFNSWWDMVTGNKPIFQKDMQPTCLDRVILPLAGAHSPFWDGHWQQGTDCHNTFILDALLKRVYRYLDITPEKHPGDDATVVTIVDRKNTRAVRNLTDLVDGARARWPDVTFQLVVLDEMSPKDQVLLGRNTDVWVGVTGAAMTHLLWLPEESSVAEIQTPNLKSGPYVGFRNLSKMRNLHYFTAHPEARPSQEGDWQMGKWIDVKPEVFNTLIDAAIYAQINRGAKSLGDVLPVKDINLR